MGVWAHRRVGDTPVAIGRLLGPLRPLRPKSYLSL
jgi:hypothetical protein